MAVEFLNELEKIKVISHLVQPVLRRASQFDYVTWAREVMDVLSNKFPKRKRSEVLKPVTDLASEMLSYLLIATRNPGRKKTPQETVHATPDFQHLHAILDLLEEATMKRSQSALKELVYWRDGFRCPFTGFAFAPPGRHVVARCAHILPFSYHDKHLTLSALETFAGRQLAKEVKDNINHPCNAFNAQADAHEAYDKLAWGIEAVSDGDDWKYIFREVRSKEVAGTINLNDGQEIIFGCGDPNGQILDKPNPEYCNIKLAIARVIHACGAADIIAEMYGDDHDDEAIINQPVYFGGPFVSDDALFRRLEDQLI